jgi:serine/threonine-protein kinase HipA
MKDIDLIHVYYHGIHVGDLQEIGYNKCAFQYTHHWLAHGFSISPLKLPLDAKIFYLRVEPFNGLFGVFDDSLPDGWGKLLMDRKIISMRMELAQVTPFLRLALVGKSGRGALEYRPELSGYYPKSSANLDILFKECEDIFDNKSNGSLDSIYQMGGCSGGAKPKVYWHANDGKEWLVKFPCREDIPYRDYVGVMEYDYMQCAENCGIKVPHYKLFKSQYCYGYFGTERFDRKNGEKIHMITAGALLDGNYREPCLDYSHLIRLTSMLTNNDAKELEQLYRLICFNFASHNTDDHAKNFSYLYDEGKWHLSPAYDLTFVNGYYGEHMTSLFGEGAHPSLEAYDQAAKLCGLKKAKGRNIKKIIDEKVENDLKKYFPDY